MCRGVNDEGEAVLPHCLQQVRNSPRTAGLLQEVRRIGRSIDICGNLR